MNDVEKHIETLARVPFFGTYLSWLAAAHATLADALNLPHFRTALYEHAPDAAKTPAEAQDAAPVEAEALRRAA